MLMTWIIYWFFATRSDAYGKRSLKFRTSMSSFGATAQRGPMLKSITERGWTVCRQSSRSLFNSETWVAKLFLPNK